MFLVKDYFSQTIKKVSAERNTTDLSSFEPIISENITEHLNINDNTDHNYRKRHIVIPDSLINNPNLDKIDFFHPSSKPNIQLFCLATPHFSNDYMVFPIAYTGYVVHDYNNATQRYFELNLTTKTNIYNYKGSIANYTGDIDVVIFNWFPYDPFIQNSINNMYKITDKLLFIHAPSESNEDGIAEFDSNGDYTINTINNNYVDPDFYNIFFSPLSLNLHETLNVSIKIINWDAGDTGDTYKLKAFQKNGRHGNHSSGGNYTGKFRWIAIHKDIGEHIKINNKPIIATGSIETTASMDTNEGYYDYYEVDISHLNLSNDDNYSVLLSPKDENNNVFMYNLQVGNKTNTSFYVKYYLKDSSDGLNAAYGGNVSISHGALISNTISTNIKFQWAIIRQL
jgi:hypothetical protein